MAPPPKLTVSQWADEYRHLSAESSAEPGRWNTSRAEFQRDMMDAISDPRVETVVVMKSAQVGGTEFINNLVGYHIHQDPAPILVIQPTTDMGEAWSKDRLAPMLRDSPALRGRVSEAKSRSGGNTLRQKKFPGGHLAIAGANSAASLASRPIRILCCDEVDRYPPSAGSEGDPVNLGRKRTTTFWNRKVVLISTPTVEGVSRIAKAFEASDQRRYWVPCPHCAERQTLKWGQVRFTDRVAATALYHCEACDKPWTDTQRWAAVRHGEWRAGAPFNGTAGFHINEIYSPWRRLAETVQDFLDAQGKPELLKVWTNTALGETWRERGDAPEWERLLERGEDYPRGVVPAGATALTLGADAQGDRLEASLWAWAPGYERWLVDQWTFPDGSPRDAAPWDALQAVMDTDFPCADGGTMRPLMACCDTGGHDTAVIYGHIRRLGDRRIAAIKGVESWNRSTLVDGPTWVDATVGGKKIRRGLKLYTVAVSSLKMDLYRALWLTRGDDARYPPGWVHLPKWIESERIKQLVGEELRSVKDKRGYLRQQWAKLRDRNEELDCAVYARAALWLAGADRLGARFWGRREAVLDAAKAAPLAPVAAVVAAEAVAQAAVARPPAPRQRPARSSRSYFGGYR